MNIEFGIYPLAGIVLSAVLYAVYRFALRMRVTPRTSQVFILAAVAFSLAATFCHAGQDGGQTLAPADPPPTDPPPSPPWEGGESILSSGEAE